jgi:hypothetical protein
MAIVFPASPSINEIFTEGSITYKWDGAKWIGLGITPADRLVEGSNSLEIDSNNLTYDQNGSVKLHVNATGLGVNTQTITGGRLIHAHNTGTGSAYFQSTNSGTGEGSSAGALFGMSGSTCYAPWNYTDGDIVMATNASPAITIKSGGNVGLGTDNPTSDGGTTLEIYNATTPTLKLNDGGDYKALFQLRGNDLEIRGSNGAMEFYTGSADGASSTKKLSITSAGTSEFTSDSSTVCAKFTGNGVYVNHAIGSEIFLGTQTGSDGKIGTTNNSNLHLFANGYANRITVNTSGSLSLPDGDLIVANGHGINFGSTTPDGTTPSSELLDDYEEGTWTPTTVLTYNPSGRTITDDGNGVGVYVKIGTLVFVEFETGYTAISGSGGFNVGVDGLPFPAEGTVQYSNAGNARSGATGSLFQCEGVINSRISTLRRYDNGGPINGADNFDGFAVYRST